jgi:predicted transcriptional regulator
MIMKNSKNPASVSSKEELTERINFGLEQIKNGQTVTHEEVVAYMKKLKASSAKGGNDTNLNPLHIS